MSWLFTSDGQSTETSASALPMNIQDLFPLAVIKSEPKSTGSRVFISDCFMVNPVNYTLTCKSQLFNTLSTPDGILFRKKKKVN